MEFLILFVLIAACCVGGILLVKTRVENARYRGQNVKSQNIFYQKVYRIFFKDLPK